MYSHCLGFHSRIKHYKHKRFKLGFTLEGETLLIPNVLSNGLNFASLHWLLISLCSVKNTNNVTQSLSSHACQSETRHNEKLDRQQMKNYSSSFFRGRLQQIWHVGHWHSCLTIKADSKILKIFCNWNVTTGAVFRL